jgi:hypothetical protein
VVVVRGGNHGGEEGEGTEGAARAGSGGDVTLGERGEREGRRQEGGLV